MKSYLLLVICSVVFALGVFTGCAKSDDHWHERKRPGSNNLVRSVDAGVIKEVTPLQNGRMVIRTDKMVLVACTDGIELGLQSS